MIKKRKSRDSNLFSIDFDAIERILLEANQTLIDRVSKIILDASSFSEGVDSADSAEKLKSYLKNLRSLKRELSAARLSDGRPFTEATKVVKKWFAYHDNKLDSLDDKFSEILANYTQNIQEEVDRIRQANEEITKNKDEIGLKTTETIGETYSGETIIKSETNEENQIYSEPVETIPEIPNIDLEWEVVSFDIDKLSLEILKPYLTDYSIMTALNNHLKEKGPNILEGVKYKKRLAKKL